jgi:Fic family protein
LLHLWLAYDHPFEEGNGRTARALFYWHMRKNGYWLAEYLSISRILRHAPAQYTRAYLQVETDELDATYFLLHQLNTTERAVHELDIYLERKVDEIRAVESLLRQSARFNHRELALLSNALRNEDAVYTFASHAGSHGVTHETARTDLTKLVKLGLLERRKDGRTWLFSPVRDLPSALSSIR